MNVVQAKIETGRALGDAFGSARGRLPGMGKVADAREQAFTEYQRTGLPNRRIEDWKYTDLRALMRELLPLSAEPDADGLRQAERTLGSIATGDRSGDSCTIVLVDGLFVATLSNLAGLENGVTAQRLRDVLENAGNEARSDLLDNGAVRDPMLALNAAMATDGVLISIAAGTELKRPLQLVHVATRASAASYTRSCVQVGEGARATLLESFVAAEGTLAYQANDAVMISLGEDAGLQHVRLMMDAPDAANVSTLIVTVGAKAFLNTFNMTTGGAVSRYQGYITAAGEGAEIRTHGVNLLNGRQHADTTLFMDHSVPNCRSREIFRAVVDDRGHSVFQGRIMVRPKAQKTDAKMMTRALLLSDEAEADNKPELEIFADDVTCGHGATSGALDGNLLFYLRARGLPEKEAQALLIQAFLGEAIEEIADEGLRELASSAARRWLEARP